MGTSGSPYSTSQDSIPGFTVVEHWKFAGADHYNSLADLNTYIAKERNNIINGGGIWRNGLRITVNGEEDYRVWLAATGGTAAQNAAASNADTRVQLLKTTGGTLLGYLTLNADPQNALHPATKQYVDGIAQNLGKRDSVRAATVGNIVIATALNAGDVIDGVTLNTGDWVMVKNQVAPADNGIYLVGPTPARVDLYDTYNEHAGALIAVQEGASQKDTIWLCLSNIGGTLGTSAINFNQSNGSNGGVLAANNGSDFSNITTVRTNLGLGTAATFDTANLPISSFTQTALNAKENTVAAGSTGGYYRFDKTWADLPTAVRAALLTGLALNLGTDVVATDTLIVALGKLQKQSTDKTTALNLKADTADVTAALNLKADTTALNSGLAAKADTTTVNNALAAKAALASPTFTGTPSVPTAVSSTNTTQAASTAFVQSVVTAAVAAVPSGDAQTNTSLAQFAATSSDQLRGVITNETGTGPLVFSASPALTGVPTVPTAVAGTNTTQIASTAFVASAIAAIPPGSGGSGDALTTSPLSQFALTTSLQLKGVISDETGSGALVFATSPTLVSPAMTGTPTVPTAAANTNTTQAASTAFVTAAIAAIPPSSGGTGDALVANPLSQFASTTSAQLNGVISDNTGAGLLVFNTSPTLAGVPTAPTAAAGANTTQLATTAFVTAAVVAAGGGDALTTNPLSQFAPTTSDQLRAVITNETGTSGGLVFAGSPTLTGVPLAPTAVVGTNTTQIASTAFVTAAIAAIPPAGNGSGDALTTDTLAQFALTTSAQLKTVISDETGTGSLVFNTAPTFSGLIISPGAEINPPAAMAALAIDTTKAVNTKSISVNSTLTLTGTPVGGQWFSLLIKNTNTSLVVVTLNTATPIFSMPQQTAITAFSIPPSGRVMATFFYDGTDFTVFGVA